MGNAVDGWLRHRKSQQSCRNVLDQFRGFCGVDSFDDLLGLEVPREAVLRWRDTLSLAPKSLNVYMSLVKSFYRHYDVDIGILPRVRGRVLNPHKVLTLEEIRRMYGFADIRMKALIMFLYNTGARINSALGLCFGRVNWREDPPLRVHFYPSETKFEVEYDTFLGAEAKAIFMDYFRWRRSRGERLVPESPLFVTKYRGRLSYGGSRHAMKVIIGKAGIRIDRNERLTHHSFRGAFQHNLQSSGVNQFMIEKMMGHYVENITPGRYSRGLTLDDLRGAYSQATWGLEVDEGKVQELENKVVETERVLGAQTMERIRLNEVIERQSEQIELIFRKLKSLEG